MLKELKRKLLDKPQSIVNILERYGFADIHIKGNTEIRCAIAEGHNSSAIRIKLLNNDGLYVTDFVRNTCDDKGKSCDLISYIIKMKNTDFISVLSSIKSELGVDDFYNFTKYNSVFGGFYENIGTGNIEMTSRIYPEEILNNYVNGYSLRFLLDNISFGTQDKFQIGYDIISQRITIPIRNQYGELIGIKGRATWDINDNESKYLYILPCMMSTTLFGYCQNYEYLNQTDVIYIGESEKFVMQCDSYGIHNCVALGSHSLSIAQCKILVELNPKTIVFMLDKGLDFDNTKININQLKSFTRMFDINIKWWDWTKNDYLPNKASPSDFGRNIMEQIIDNEIVEVKL